MSKTPIQVRAGETPALPVPKLAFNVAEAAQALGVSTVSVYRLISRGKLRALRCLRHRVIPAAELHAFLQRETTA